jgi:hypothetical protein
VDSIRGLRYVQRFLPIGEGNPDIGFLERVSIDGHGKKFASKKPVNVLHDNGEWGVQVKFTKDFVWRTAE